MVFRKISLLWNLIHYNVFQFEVRLSKTLATPVIDTIQLKDAKEYYERNQMESPEQDMLNNLDNVSSITNRITADAMLLMLSFLLHYTFINIWTATTGLAPSQSTHYIISILGALAFNYEMLYKENKLINHHQRFVEKSNRFKIIGIITTIVSILVIFAFTSIGVNL